MINNFKLKRIQKNFSKFEPPSMTPNIKIYWNRAKGFYIWNQANQRYIDFTSSIFVTNIGHSNKKLIKKVQEVLNSPLTHSYVYYNKFRYEYIKKLIKFIDHKKLNKCYLMSSGTESTEAALKLMRLNGKKINNEKKGIICIKGNWHGRTLGALMMSGMKNQTKWIGYKDKNIHHLDFPYPWIKKFNTKKFFRNSLRKKFKKKYNYKKKIAGIMIEAFQGWGAIFYPKNYIRSLVKFAKQNNIIIAIDEIQSGFARTGKKFAFEHYGFIPDILCCGKGMGSGLPLSGIITSKKIMDIEDGFLQSTHSANPISCAAGIAVIDEIKRLNLVKKSFKLGTYLNDGLKNFKKEFPEIIKCTLGKGLLAAIIFKKYKSIEAKDVADQISAFCLKRKLLIVNTGRESIKLGPPLIIDIKGIKKALKIIRESIIELRKIHKIKNIRHK